MDLKDFIRTTLVQIHEGVVSASAETGGAVGAVPLGETTTTMAGSALFRDVDFDVALTAVDDGTSSAKVDIKVASFRKTGGGSETSVSRVRFSVPILVPGNIRHGDHVAEVWRQKSRTGKG